MKEAKSLNLSKQTSPAERSLLSASADPYTSESSEVACVDYSKPLRFGQPIPKQEQNQSDAQSALVSDLSSSLTHPQNHKVRSLPQSCLVNVTGANKMTLFPSNQTNQAMVSYAATLSHSLAGSGKTSAAESSLQRMRTQSQVSYSDLTFAVDESDLTVNECIEGDQTVPHFHSAVSNNSFDAPCQIIIPTENAKPQDPCNFSEDYFAPRQSLVPRKIQLEDLPSTTSWLQCTCCHSQSLKPRLEECCDMIRSDLSPFAGSLVPQTGYTAQSDQSQAIRDQSVAQVQKHSRVLGLAQIKQCRSLLSAKQNLKVADSQKAQITPTAILPRDSATWARQEQLRKGSRTYLLKTRQYFNFNPVKIITPQNKSKEQMALLLDTNVTQSLKRRKQLLTGKVAVKSTPKVSKQQIQKSECTELKKALGQRRHLLAKRTRVAYEPNHVEQGFSSSNTSVGHTQANNIDTAGVSEIHNDGKEVLLRMFEHHTLRKHPIAYLKSAEDQGADAVCIVAFGEEGVEQDDGQSE